MKIKNPNSVLFVQILQDLVAYPYKGEPVNEPFPDNRKTRLVSCGKLPE